MHHPTRRSTMDHQDILAWGATTASMTQTAAEEDGSAEVDEPPDHRQKQKPDFHRSSIKLSSDRKESLLTRAIAENVKSDTEVTSDVTRRRSLLSVVSSASTVDLTSDGGLTSPARTNTPSPPCPPSSYMSFAPYNLQMKPTQTSNPRIVKLDTKDPETVQLSATPSLPKPDPIVEALVKKRCISFACGAQKPKNPTPLAPQVGTVAPVTSTTQPAKKRCMIKFACPGPRAAAKAEPIKEAPTPVQAEHIKFVTPTKSTEPNRRLQSRSPSSTRKPRQTPPTFLKLHRDSITQKETQIPTAIRSRKPKYIAAIEDSVLSEATRFHEFASDEPQEDDWIREDISETKKKLTINDTLEKENAIRRLGKEAEDEALQDEQDEEDDVDDVENVSDDENDDEEDVDDMEDLDQDEDDATVEGSDGNETDNEAGFADSDDESDAAGDFQFWTPGRSIFNSKSDDRSMIRPSGSGHRAESVSSIDSLKHMYPNVKALTGANGRRTRSRRIKIRPGTPDLPDSTDFVCGTLDEDRPLEDAYVSCMEARKREKHFLIPQDIDPSFPTSDPEDAEEDEVDEEEAQNDSDEHVWLHGQFEDSDVDDVRSRRRMTRSPGHSPKRLHSPPPPKRLHSPPPPKRLHSPPPAKNRHRSPPPARRLFGVHSPKRLRSPPPARHVSSPPGSPTAYTSGLPIAFAPLGQRPGLTHTKSLPRTPNAFCKQYHESRLAALRNAENSDPADVHTRGAIDIVKGLEQKRQRRKEKFYQKHCNRARKVGQPERKPQPGKGAERMRELGLLMAGKLEIRTGKAEFVLSV